MGNYLYSLGLDFLMEEEDTIRGVVGDTVRNGKVINGYYQRPYINNHYGPVQIVARLGPGEKEDVLSIKGFDTHCDSMSCWKLRILEKLDPEDEDDVTNIRILAKSEGGNSILHVDVLNGDILPSFKKDELIELQMVAFSDQAEFFADEEAYERFVMSKEKLVQIIESFIKNNRYASNKEKGYDRLR